MGEIRRYDPIRPRWRQGLLNWVWLLWPSCHANDAVDGQRVQCMRRRWHRGPHTCWTITWGGTRG